MILRRRLAALPLVLFMAGCWGTTPPGPTVPTPTNTTTTTPTTSPSTVQTVFSAGTALGAGRITVHAHTPAGGPISGAMVWLEGPTPAWGNTDSNGNLALSPLAAGSYRVRVTADGYGASTSTVSIAEPINAAGTPGAAPDQTSTPVETTLTLSTAAGHLGGQVASIAGPIAGALVSVGEAYTLTDAAGAFVLANLVAGNATVTITKGGFAPASRNVAIAADSSLGAVTMTAATPVVSLENGSDLYDQQFSTQTTVRQALAPLASAVTSAGMTWSEASGQATVKILACPNAVSDQTAQSLKAFVAAGGRLVLLGEWGGASGYSPEALNKVATLFGMAFNPDLVRSSNTVGQAGWIKANPVGGPVPIVEPMPLGITLFDSASLFAAPDQWAIARSGSTGYRIAAVDPAGVLLAGARGYGAGLVVLVGDTSAWTTGSITGNAPGGTNLGEANNRQFMLNLLRW